MRVCVLASGSNGNACLVEAGATRLLIDAGVGIRRLSARLADLDLEPCRLDHVVLTHAHRDHVLGLPSLLKKAPDLTLHATRGTAGCLPEPARSRARELRAGRPLTLGALDIHPFATPHDAPGSVGFRVEGDGCVLGYATDLGQADGRVTEALTGAHALVVEANHCPELLAGGRYPAFLKQRVAGPRGHLSNPQCRRLLERILHPGLEHVTLAHLSAANNSSEAIRLSVGALLEETLPGGWSVGSRAAALPPIGLGAPARSR